MSEASRREAEEVVTKLWVLSLHEQRVEVVEAAIARAVAEKDTEISRLEREAEARQRDFGVWLKKDGEKSEEIARLRRAVEGAAVFVESGQVQIGCTAEEAAGVVRRTRDALAAALRAPAKFRASGDPDIHKQALKFMRHATGQDKDAPGEKA